jgi:periplasmic divalent cation tolerance protein
MDSKQDDCIVVLITTGTNDEAVRIAEMLVGSNLAACVQILQEMESIYRWHGRIRRDAEHLLLVKTTAESFDELEKAVRLLHSYDTPEIVALPMVAGSEPYVGWLRDNVKRSTVRAGKSNGRASRATA